MESTTAEKEAAEKKAREDHEKINEKMKMEADDKKKAEQKQTASTT
jgi:hypothetical protein